MLWEAFSSAEIAAERWWVDGATLWADLEENLFDAAEILMLQWNSSPSRTTALNKQHELQLNDSSQSTSTIAQSKSMTQIQFIIYLLVIRLKNVCSQMLSI